MVQTRPTLAMLAADLAAGRTTSRELVEAALARIADPAGEGARVFVKVYADSARAAADAQDRLRRAGYVASPLAGLPVSIKDLFDVAGEVTLGRLEGARRHAAGDRATHRSSRACSAAGAVLIGRTNMTEFAFSGVGINPHYGTPGNPHDRSLIPGGSSSGAAVSVGDGRRSWRSAATPAARCASRRRCAALSALSRPRTAFRATGATPLSTTLDSIGPLADSVACCAIADAVMAGEPPKSPRADAGRRPAAGVPQLLCARRPRARGGERLRACVAPRCRAPARGRRSAARRFDEFPAINASGGFAPIEAYAWHETLIARRGDEYDPRVSARIERAGDDGGRIYRACARRGPT